jgi:hypothetical protein
VSRLFADENFPLPVVEELRVLGHDVLTMYETGKAGQGVSDAEVLEYAVAERRTILTLNRKHFVQLHRQRPNHAGIDVCTSNCNFTAQGRRIHSAIAAQSDHSGKLIRVNRPGPADSRLSERDTAP